MQNAPLTFGDTGKNILRGPRYFSIDLAMVKNAKLTERLALEFRTEFFNAFNNVNFGKPDGNFLLRLWNDYRNGRRVILQHLRNGSAPNHSIRTEVGILTTGWGRRLPRTQQALFEKRACL